MDGLTGGIAVLDAMRIELHTEGGAAVDVCCASQPDACAAPGP